MKNVVIVESPAKAKTINRYLGKDFIVLASFGHIRDLPSKNGSVRPEEDFAFTWETDERAKKHIAEIAKAVRGADHLYLATDPDREGEVISWHVQQVLSDSGALSAKTHATVQFAGNGIFHVFEYPYLLEFDNSTKTCTKLWEYHENRTVTEIPLQSNQQKVDEFASIVKAYIQVFSFRINKNQF